VICMYLLVFLAAFFGSRLLKVSYLELLMVPFAPFFGSLIVLLFGVALREYVVTDLPALAKVGILSATCISAYLLIQVFVFKLTMPLSLLQSAGRGTFVARFPMARFFLNIDLTR
jgi:hypothetical protein